MNNFPYDEDDSEEMLNQSMIDDESLIQNMDFNSAADRVNAVRNKYFTNQVMGEASPESESIIGKTIGKSLTREPSMVDVASKNDRDPFQPPKVYEDAMREAEQVKVDEIPEQENEITPKEVKSKELSLIEQYNKLMEERKASNRNLGLQQGMNQIAQAVANGYGAKIGDGSEALNQLRKDNELPTEQFLNQGKVAGLKKDISTNDPNSDISKYYRYQVMKKMKEQNPTADLNQFNDMTASELKDILDNSTKKGGRGDLFFKEIKDSNGNDVVVGVDRVTGEIVKTIGKKSTSDKIITNPEDGTQQIYNQVTGLQDLRQAGNKELNSDTTKLAPEQIKQQNEVLNSPTVLAKTNPNLYKQFKKDQESFLKSVQDNREVATGATTLAYKLVPGENGNIDSGLLGGIQTQAAKMAGQKGVLTDQDLVKFAGAGGVKAKIDRILDGTLFGQMSDDDTKFFKKFAEKMNEANNQDVMNRSKVFIDKNYNEAKNYIPGLTPQNIEKWLNVQSMVPSAQPAKDNSNMVKMQLPDGSIKMIPKENVEKALQRKAKVVN